MMELLTRSAADSPLAPPSLHMLPTQQRVVLEVIRQYCEATNEPCPGSYLSRRLRVHHSTIQQHLSTLYRKGFLAGPNAPAMLRSR